MKFGFDQYYILALGLASCAGIIMATQYRYQMVPDQLLIVMIMLGFLYRTLVDGQIYDMVHSFVLAVLLALFFSAMYEKACKKKIENFGLLKLVAVVGIWLSSAQLLIYFLLISLAAILAVFVARLTGRSFTLLLGVVLVVPFLAVIHSPDLPQKVLSMITSGGV